MVADVMVIPHDQRPAERNPAGRTATSAATGVPSSWPDPCHCAADVIALTITDEALKLLVIARSDMRAGSLALPGVLLGGGETLEQAAIRALQVEAGWTVKPGDLTPMAAHSSPDRDQRGRVVAYPFVIAQPRLSAWRFGGPRDLQWADAGQVLASGRLAFDHDQMVTAAIALVGRRIEHTSLAATFCPEAFTITQLRRVYETIWGCPLDEGNFHRKMQPYLAPAGSAPRSGRGRPAALYLWAGPDTLNPAITRPADAKPYASSTGVSHDLR